MKGIFSALFLMLTIAALAQNHKTPDTKTRNPVFSNTSFQAFFERFSNDRDFQISSIVFPLKLIQVDDEDGNTNKFIQKKDWKHIDLLKLKSKKDIVKIVNSKKDEIIVQHMVEGTGVLVEHFFQYKNEKWQLAYVKDESD